MNIAKQIGNKIRYLRKSQGLSQEMLAFNANMNPAFLGHLERGIKNPTVASLEKIATALHVPLVDLFIDSAPPGSDDDKRSAAQQRLFYLTQTLSPDKAEQITKIIEDILKFNNLH